MLLAAVVRLEALEEGYIEGGTGRDVHGLWFHQWKAVAPAWAERLHGGSGVKPFTLSPLLGLPRPRKGKQKVSPVDAAWFRVSTLQGELSRRLQEDWLPRLPDEISLAGLRWRVVGYTTSAEEHPWAGQGDAQVLADTCLLDRSPPESLRLQFLTPTTFHGSGGHLPFPLPDALVRSWLRRWQALGPVRLPDSLLELARERLLISSYRLVTVPAREGRRMTIGCVGRMTLRGVRLRPGERAAFHLLAAYAFYAGSGHRTTQGLGMTRLR